MNSDELARNKFNALFADHDAKERPAAIEKKESTKKPAAKKRP